MQQEDHILVLVRGKCAPSMLAVKSWILAQSASCFHMVLLELQAFTQMHLSQTRSEDIYKIVTQKYPKSVKILRAYVRYSDLLQLELLGFLLSSFSPLPHFYFALLSFFLFFNLCLRTQLSSSHPSLFAILPSHQLYLSKHTWPYTL